MRTEAEITEALDYIRRGKASTMERVAREGPDETTQEIALMQFLANDVLQWVLGKPNGFEVNILAPCRQRDRAERQ